MKQLPPEHNPDIPQDFLDQIQTEADRQVEDLSQVAFQILSQIPGRVAERIKSFRLDWSTVSLAVSSASDGGASSL